MVKDVLRRAVGAFFAVALLLNSVACTSYSEPVEPVPTSIPLVTETPEDGPLVLSAVGEPSEADFSLTMLDVGQGLSIPTSSSTVCRNWNGWWLPTMTRITSAVW